VTSGWLEIFAQKAGKTGPSDCFKKKISGFPQGAGQSEKL
jgi:hypothetical protein